MTQQNRIAAELYKPECLTGLHEPHVLLESEGWLYELQRKSKPPSFQRNKHKFLLMVVNCLENDIWVELIVLAEWK